MLFMVAELLVFVEYASLVIFVVAITRNSLPISAVPDVASRHVSK